jgi:hypothetical protein
MVSDMTELETINQEMEETKKNDDCSAVPGKKQTIRREENEWMKGKHDMYVQR